ncbi:hypothetical protein ELQ35_20395 [Peribacillus cavernae]|uniref:General stress protein 17M-like domain-containing protein n=1 Tax=Peribacillus cavernae TaxID=1674310 RepID=A0A433HAQ9_9BACI|nr:general stress protein [Peribacillus cavernae]MDQ0220111.1 hypothetical protein [Peribacillus cavernae]RUQ25471.1 hypothetical protein ELQ35_20395 [Peribacillus cavernae]
MEKTMYGVFDSTSEVIQAIQALKAKGFEGEDITVIADKVETLNLADYKKTAGVNTVTNTPEDDGFMDKVMRFFMNEGTYGLEDRLHASGFSDSETAAYVNNVEEGKILILLDSDKDQTVRDGFFEGDPDPAALDAAGTNRDAAIQTGVTRNPDPNLFPEGTAAVQETTGNLSSNRDRSKTGYVASARTEKDRKLTDQEKRLREKQDEVQLDSEGNPQVQDEQLKNRINTDNL